MLKTNSLAKSFASGRLFFLLLGFLLAFVLMIAHHFVAYAVTQQTLIGCHASQQQIAKYCVYVTHKSGIFADVTTLIIGQSADRGLFYEVPYEAEQVQASWDAQDNVTVSMPGTTLTISTEEYLDLR